MGEFLIHPIFVCTLYGFINDRTWRFDNRISACNFLFFLYGVIMDALYMKVIVILCVIKVVRTIDDEHLLPHHEYETIMFAIMIALTHWFMIGINGMRIFTSITLLHRKMLQTAVDQTQEITRQHHSLGI